MRPMAYVMRDRICARQHEWGSLLQIREDSDGVPQTSDTGRGTPTSVLEQSKRRRGSATYTTAMVCSGRAFTAIEHAGCNV